MKSRLCMAVVATSFGQWIFAASPVPSVEPGYGYDGIASRAPGATIQLRVVFSASDADGDLRGIRPNVWHPATGYFNNNNAAFVPVSGSQGQVAWTVPISQNGDWYFWTDVEDNAGNYASTGHWGSGHRVRVEEGSPQAPRPSIVVDRVSTSDKIVGQDVVVRFRAFDPDGNLTGIRPNIWHPDSGYFYNNRDGFITQSGQYGEVVQTVRLDKRGVWYFWTDSTDANGNYASTGDWGSGYKVEVSATTSAPRGSAWADVNGDGIVDEIFQAPAYMNPYVGYSTGGCSGINWSIYWNPLDILFWYGDYRSRFNIFFASPSLSWCFSTTYVSMVVSFTAEAGYEYGLMSDFSGSSTANLASMTPFARVTGTGPQYFTYSNLPLPVAQNLKFWVVRYGQKTSGVGLFQNNQLLTSSTGSTISVVQNENSNFILKALDLLGRLLGDVERVVWRITQANSTVRTIVGPQLNLGQLLPGAYLIFVSSGDGREIPIPVVLDNGGGVTALWETANPSNRIFNPTPKDDPWDNGRRNGPTRNYLFSVAGPDNRHRITVQAALGDPTAYLAAAYSNGIKVTGSDARFSTAGLCSMDFSHTGSNLRSIPFSIRVGKDQNQNSTLDVGEEYFLPIRDQSGAAVGPAIVMGIPLLAQTEADAFISAVALGGKSSHHYWSEATSLVRLFYSGDPYQLPITLRPTLPTPLANFNCFSGSFSDWLTHNAGEAFASDGAALIGNYQWLNNSRFSSAMLDTLPVKGVVQSAYNSSVSAQVATYYRSNSDARWFPLDGSFVDVRSYYTTSATVPSEKFVDLRGIVPAISNAHLAFGRAKVISHLVRFYVQPTYVPGTGLTPRITQVQHTGEFQDLYDFNFEDGGAGERAAILQLKSGASGGTPGKIYRSRFTFEQVVRPF